MTRTIIQAPGRLNLPPLREFWEAREVLYRFGIRDIVLRYRQTVIGVIWVVLQPVASAGIFSIVFGGVAGLKTGDVPYFLFSFVGMLAWNVFNNVVSRASASLMASSTKAPARSASSGSNSTTAPGVSASASLRVTSSSRVGTSCALG